MKRVFVLGVASTLLSACVSTEPPESSSSSVMSSSSSEVKSSSSMAMSSSSLVSSSSSISSSSVSSVMSSSSMPAFDGDVARGRALIKDTSGNCFICHEDGNEDGFFEAKANSNGIDVNNFEYQNNPTFASGNYTGASVQDLARFIAEQMPNSTTCTGQCANDIAAYLWSLKGKQVVVGPTECESEDPAFFGRRSLKFLTTYEYHNSLQGLFGAPLPADYSSPSKIAGDIDVGGLPNHGFASLNEGRMNSYDANAAELAAWAVKTSGALSFSCSAAASCAESFINDFALYAFRRPLTDDEVAEYTAIISEASSLEAGLEWAIRSALMSPQFLYRSELGETVATTLVNLENAPAKVVYVPAEEPVVLESGQQNPSQAGYTFTGNDLVMVTLTASPALDYSSGQPVETDRWPAVRLQGNGFETAPIPVTSKGPITLTFYLDQLTGPVYYITAQTVQEHDGVMYGGMVNVQKMAFAPATVAETSETFKQKLEQLDPSAFVLSEFEFASALSFMLTGSAPDKQLMSAALSGRLSEESSLESEVDRLIDSELGKKQIERFAGLWFGTDKVKTVNRFGNDDFTPAVKASMAQEIRELYKHVFYDESVPYKSLFSADYTMLNKTLSDFYGLPGATGDEFVKVSTEGTKRGGVIASGAFMALYAHDDRSSPIKRAVHVRQDMLCQSIPQPGALDGDDRKAAQELAQAKEAEGTLTTTEFYDIQTNVPGTGCAVCHNAVINPLFAIDDFDNVGLPRKEVGGLVVQKGLGSTGQADIPIDMVNDGGYLYLGGVVGGIDTQEADRAKDAGDGVFFKGAKQLSKALVDNELPGIDACLVQKSYRFALGSPMASADVDSRFEASLSAEEKGHLLCVQDQLQGALGAQNNPRAMLKKLSMSDVIRFRR